MKRNIAAMTTLALFASASAPALADLVEMTISGSSASSEAYITDGTLDIFDTDWSFVVVYDTAASWGLHDVSVHQAWFVVDGERRNLDMGFDPSIGFHEGFQARQRVASILTDPDGSYVSGEIFFNLGFEGDISAVFFGEFIRYTLAAGLDRMRDMPVGFTLDDFDEAMTAVDLGQGNANSDSLLWSTGGEWILNASSISVRTVPTPAPLAMLAGLGVLAARRRR